MMRTIYRLERSVVWAIIVFGYYTPFWLHKVVICLPIHTESHDDKYQGSKCPSLPGLTHWVNTGLPGLGFKPYFGKWAILGNKTF